MSAAVQLKSRNTKSCDPISSSAVPRGEIVPLTGLRGLAAGWVFLYHAIQLTHDLDPASTLPLRALGRAGYLGVDLFFVLSGFVIAYTYAADELHRSVRSYAHFLWKRIARIWPANTVALLFFGSGLAIYSTTTDLSLIGFLRSVTMTQAWGFPGQPTWNPVAWSVSCEWAAYLVFPLIALATRRISLRLALLGILAAYLALYVAFRVGPFGDGPATLGLQRVAASFVAGVLVYRIWMMRRVSLDGLGWAALVLMICGTSVLDVGTHGGESMSYAPILSCAIVYALATSRGALARSFSRLRYAGCISYSFYLVHWVPLTIAHTLLERAGVMDSVVWVSVAICGGLLSAIALADFLYRYIEEPARRGFLSLTQRSRAAMRAAQPSPSAPTMATRRT